MSFVLRRAVLFLAIAAMSAASSDAAELCVVCTDPSATYRCQIDRAGVTGTQAQLLCITELAKSGGHASCSVERHADLSCDGSLAVVRPDLATDEPAIASPDEPNEPVHASDAAEPAPAEPATVASELKKAGTAAGETAKAAGKKIEGASDAVGSAAKKSWDCIKSFFSNC